VHLYTPLTTDQLLIDYEICPRKGFWRNWQRAKLTTGQVLQEALSGTLTAENHGQESSYGEMAAEKVLDLAASPGLLTDWNDTYACVINHACLADILMTAIRKPDSRAWLSPEQLPRWTPSCLMAPEGNMLRRIALVSHWTKDRHTAECRGWKTLGPMAHYQLPMQIIVLNIGPEKNGRRHSHWTKCIRHTIGDQNIRFRRRVGRGKGGNSTGGFKDSWHEIWREDHDEISKEHWLNMMLKDDVLNDLCFRIDMPALTGYQASLFRDLARRKLDKIERMKDKPPLQLTGCDWPVKCPFLKCCHAIPELQPSPGLGYVQISPRTSYPPADSRTEIAVLPDPGSPAPESPEPLPLEHS
jgi:hypothetical protein